MSDWISAKIYMSKIDDNNKHLNINLEPEGNYYRIDVKLSNIGTVMVVPDSEGIPLSDYCRINVFGFEYVIEYPIKKLRKLLNISNDISNISNR